MGEMRRDELAGDQMLDLAGLILLQARSGLGEADLWSPEIKKPQRAAALNQIVRFR
jgi:hypothetical protein